MKTHPSPTTPQGAGAEQKIRTQLKPIYAELRDSCVARVYLADSVEGVLAQRDNQHALLTARNKELVAALDWIEATAVNLHCALQATAHMDPSDSRIAVETGRVVKDLLVLRDKARALLSQPNA